MVVGGFGVGDVLGLGSSAGSGFGGGAAHDFGFLGGRREGLGGGVGVLSCWFGFGMCLDGFCSVWFGNIGGKGEYVCSSTIDGKYGDHGDKAWVVYASLSCFFVGLGSELCF